MGCLSRPVSFTWSSYEPPSPASVKPSPKKCLAMNRFFYSSIRAIRRRNHIPIRALFLSPLNGESLSQCVYGDGGGGRNDNNGNNSGGGWHEEGSGSSGSYPNHRHFILFSIFFCSAAWSFCCFGLASAALARTATGGSSESESGSVWEVRGGKWTKLVPNGYEDSFVVESGIRPSSSSLLGSVFSVAHLWIQCKEVIMRLMLPEGYPESVTSDYLDYSLWRGVQGVASQISGVLATQVRGNSVKKLETKQELLVLYYDFYMYKFDFLFL